MRRHTSLFLLVLALYAVLVTLFAVRTPAWQAPDEPAHYNYIRQAAEGKLLPIIEDGDWDNATLEQLKAERFQGELAAAIPAIEYEDHQPPLYYWLAAPIYALTDGSLTALRLFSAFLGLFTLSIAYATVRLLYPDAPWVALVAVAFIAFLPQHLMILGSVNNDALAGVVMSALLYGCLRYRLRGDVHPAWLGLGLGVVVLTKTTIYFMAAVVLLTVLLRWRSERASWSRLLRPLLLITLAAGGFALFWFGRNILTYGFPDIMGLRAHDEVVVGQLRTADLIAQIGFVDYLIQLKTITFQSFWGQFGWMGVPMHNLFFEGESLAYIYAGAIMLLAALGLWIGRSRAPLKPDRRDAHLILLSVAGLAVLVFLYYNTQFVQFQGRYLFSALIPFSLWLALGLTALGRRFGAPWLGLIAPLGLAALAFYVVWRVLPGALG
jgi:4-amino-4-deoxy-L-arabinose transferase-like glycosyltransferase